MRRAVGAALASSWGGWAVGAQERQVEALAEASRAATTPAFEIWCSGCARAGAAQGEVVSCRMWVQDEGAWWGIQDRRPCIRDR